jgi:hypothetical protein
MGKRNPPRHLRCRGLPQPDGRHGLRLQISNGRREVRAAHPPPRPPCHRSPRPLRLLRPPGSSSSHGTAPPVSSSSPSCRTSGLLLTGLRPWSELAGRSVLSYQDSLRATLCLLLLEMASNALFYCYCARYMQRGFCLSKMQSIVGVSLILCNVLTPIRLFASFKSVYIKYVLSCLRKKT